MDDTHHSERRIIVAGTSGAGKTTIARRIAERLGLSCVEIDSLFHGPGWVPRESFVIDVDRFSAQKRWVTEWQYEVVRDLLAERATTMVWLDLPRSLVMWQVMRRTLVRRVRRVEMWNGNREGPLYEFFVDRNHIVRWAWRTHASTRNRIMLAIEEHPHLDVVQLRSRRDARAWVESLPNRSAQHG